LQGAPPFKQRSSEAGGVVSNSTFDAVGTVGASSAETVSTAVFASEIPTAINIIRHVALIALAPPQSNGQLAARLRARVRFSGLQYQSFEKDFQVSA